MAVSSLTAVALFMAGWSSDNRYALFGAARGVAVLISYEVPVVLSLLGVVMIAGSMSLGAIVHAQQVPFILVQPLAFFLFLAGMSAELNRTPFDVAEAESEIIGGYHTEYSGIKFALIQAAEFGGVLVVSALITTMFLGGWGGPFSEYLGWLWFLLKSILVVALFSWIRATYPRLRIDQIMGFCWKVMLPLSLINLTATTLEVFFLPENGTTMGEQWIMAGINLSLALVCVPLFGKLMREKARPGSSPAGARVVPGIPTIESR